MTDFEKLWDKSGEVYTDYAAVYPQYVDTNKVIAKIADIVPGQTVVDLGCGTGLTARAVSEHLRGRGKVYCIDFAQDMLEQARQDVDSRVGEFIAAPAEDLAKCVKGPVDRVVCNAALWQFRDKDVVLQGIKQILKPDGEFVFSLPQQFYEMPGESHRGLIVKAIFDELKMRGYNPEGSFVDRYTEDSLKELLARNGLRMQSIEKRELSGTTLEDGLAFFAIPG